VLELEHQPRRAPRAPLRSPAPFEIAACSTSRRRRSRRARQARRGALVPTTNGLRRLWRRPRRARSACCTAISDWRGDWCAGVTVHSDCASAAPQPSGVHSRRAGIRTIACLPSIATRRPPLGLARRCSGTSRTAARACGRGSHFGGGIRVIQSRQDRDPPTLAGEPGSGGGILIQHTSAATS
jgi:hypothetical protein